MDDSPQDLDIHNYGPRLRKLAIAAVIGGVFTFFCVKAMTESGRGPNPDPVGMGSVGMVAFAMFIVVTMVTHKILSKKYSSTKKRV
jgi:hypothetical protein